MRFIILQSVVRLGLQYYFTSSHKRHAFRKTIYLTSKAYFNFNYKICLKNFSLLDRFCEIFSYTYIGLHVNYQLFLSDFNKKVILSTDIRKTLKYKI